MYSIGIDLHKESLYWTVLDEKRSVVWQERTATDDKTVADTFSALACAPSECKVAVEPTLNWQQFAEHLTDLGAEVHIANPQAVGLIAKNRLKNDKVDSKILADLLYSGFLPESYIAPKAVRELREIVRWRTHLVHVRTTLKNRVHSIILKHGLKYPGTDLFGIKGRVWLADIKNTLGEREQIDSLMRVLDTADGELKGIYNLVRRAVNHTPTARLLSTLPGVGSIVALIITAEVGDFKRFPSPDKLCSYAGLIPSSYSSGASVRHGNITKRGSPLLRWAMVQAAQRVNPSWGRLWVFHEQLARRVGNKKARVALARKLLTVSWHMATKNEPFKLEPVHASGGVKR